ncbi:VOC family protein [Oxalicibacterium solurbis]|uniref:VOC family protein n=1 Tax=Oxalicibacterium solurbis TaxID=69280 RepID=A0A8J3AV98_9BURK|nr:VOC family protein [Oxalicibacterium solurbis]GGI53572.1 VOC family protein [Oxalicibacterium solurbis]
MATVKPFLMFQDGNAQAALDLYFATFPDSGMLQVERYTQDGLGLAGTIKVAVFTLCGREFMCSDSPVKHNFSFTPSSSIFVEFDSVAELEHVFGILSKDGGVLMPLDNYGFSQRFGWINDRFGVSWQLNYAG